MQTQEALIHIAILITAVWRLTAMINSEEGAFGIFSKLRNAFGVLTIEVTDYDYSTDGHEYTEILPSRLQPTHLARGITCHYCTSVWVATALLTFYFIVISFSTPDMVLVLAPLSASAVSIFIEEKL